MKKHAYVFLAFLHPEMVRSSFDSICNHSDIDFYIIENPSEGTPEIEEYLLSKKDKIKRYVRYDNNIILTAYTLYLRENIELFKTYDYLTVTDGDIYVYDIVDTMNEIYYMLELSGVIVASCSAFLGNYFNDHGSYKVKDRVCSLDNFLNYMKIRDRLPHGFSTDPNPPWVTDSKGPGVNRITRHGGFLGTVKKENIDVFTIPHICADTYIEQQAWKKNGFWARTNNNLCYHLRWDLHVPGNPYYEIINKNQITAYTQCPPCNYKIII